MRGLAKRNLSTLAAEKRRGEERKRGFCVAEKMGARQRDINADFRNFMVTTTVLGSVVAKIELKREGGRGKKRRDNVK